MTPPAATTAAPRLPALAPTPQLGFQASIAEFLLMIRLRARCRSAPAADVLERAARIVFVTCQHWFAAAHRHRAGQRTCL